MLKPFYHARFHLTFRFLKIMFINAKSFHYPNIYFHTQSGDHRLSLVYAEVPAIHWIESKMHFQNELTSNEGFIWMK